MKFSELFKAWPANFAIESQQDLSDSAPSGQLAHEPHNIRARILAQDVSAIVFDSRKVQTHSVYIAIRGEKSDGHAYLADAANAGAEVLVVEDLAQVPKEFGGLIFKVESSRAALARLAARFYGDPSQGLFSVAVTGTNGKTTTTYVVEALLDGAGLPTGVIGTINHHLLDKVWPSEMTTPDPVSFQLRLKDFKDAGARAVALEASSHALDQHRVDAVEFDVAIFTNLTRDHLDYHVTMERYFEAKARLFTELLAQSKKTKKIAIVNGDDPHSAELVAGGAGHAGESIPPKTAIGGIEVWRYGLGHGFELQFAPLEKGYGGTKFQLNTPMGPHEFTVRMPGLHNVYNAAAAIGAALVAGASLESIAETLTHFTGVPGRLQSVPNLHGVFAFVDYAHTDDAIRTVLANLNGIRHDGEIENQIITVFGCGGDRDRGKRPLMMKAALEGSDVVILTSDNPRTEDPQAIMNDAAVELDPTLIGHKVHQIVDRRAAMQKAVALAQAGDVILIAGKGHEDYQIIGTTKQPFSDFEIMKELLA